MITLHLEMAVTITGDHVIDYNRLHDYPNHDISK